MKKNLAKAICGWMLAGMLLLCLTACPNDLWSPPEPFTRRIGPNGGTLRDPAGCTLVIPAGALTESTAITMTTLRDTLDLGTEQSDLAGALFGVKLEPEGLEFAVPATLRLTPARTTASGEYPLFWFDAAGERWVQTGHATIAAGSDYAETTIDHFSSYAIFDMPYDILDDFDEFVTERSGTYTAAELGDLYGSLFIDEEESFIGPDQYYNGCCYMRIGASMVLQYTYQGSHTGYWETGVQTDKSYVLSYSFSGPDLTYSIDLTVYLSCEQAEADLAVSADQTSLERNESTVITTTYTCGESREPVSGRIIAFTLDGPGRLNRSNATTDGEGTVTITYTAGDEDGTAIVTASLENCSCGLSALNPPVVSIMVGASLLDGTWDRGDIKIIVSGASGVFSEISGEWLNAAAAGFISLGSDKFRGITQTGDLTWSCWERWWLKNLDSGEIIDVGWASGAITMNADHDSFTTRSNDPWEGSSATTSYTRVPPVSSARSPFEGAQPDRTSGP